MLWPAKFTLHQNSPNPFNSTAVTSYEVPRLSNVSLVVLDMMGRKIQTLVSGRREPGIYSVAFRAEQFASGIYFYSLHVGDSLVETRKMLILK